jgi:holliday junction DNA helicase RuvA
MYTGRMFVYMRGKINDHERSMVVLESAGIGYGVVTLLDEQGSMKIGEEVTLYISENIKEDAHDLYGFLTKSRRELFRLLTSVNGVGPKAGMSITGLASEQLVRRAIAEGDTAFISRASGVGKKVAERVIVDLKSKVGLIASESATDFLSEGHVSDSDEAVQALVALGHTLLDAKEIMKHIDPSLPLDKRVALALRGGR